MAELENDILFSFSFYFVFGYRFFNFFLSMQRIKAFIWGSFFFLHYEWFLEFLEKNLIPSIMHTTVSGVIYTVWHYQLWSFKTRDTKLDLCIKINMPKGNDWILRIRTNILYYGKRKFFPLLCNHTILHHWMLRWYIWSLKKIHKIRKILPSDIEEVARINKYC